MGLHVAHDRRASEEGFSDGEGQAAASIGGHGFVHGDTTHLLH